MMIRVLIIACMAGKDEASSFAIALLELPDLVQWISAHVIVVVLHAGTPTMSETHIRFLFRWLLRAVSPSWLGRI